MAFILHNLSDDRLSELSSAIYAEAERRFRLKDWSHIVDNPALSGAERIKFIRANNNGVGLREAHWLAAAKE